MKKLGSYAIGALMLAAPALGATLASTAPANAGISIGLGLGLGGHYDPCSSFDYRYYHPYECAYRPGWAWGDGYWIVDSFGHRHWHGHRRGEHRGNWNYHRGHDSHRGHDFHHDNHSDHGHDSHGHDHGGHDHHH